MAEAVGNDAGSSFQEDGQVRPHREGKMQGLSWVQWLGLYASNVGALGLIPGQGTRSHTPQPRICMPQLKILSPTTKTWCSQINKYEGTKRRDLEGKGVSHMNTQG